MAVSNHAFGHAQSAEAWPERTRTVSVTANQCYLLGAWLHGVTFASLSAGVDEEDDFHGWIVRLEFSVPVLCRPSTTRARVWATRTR